MTLAEYAKCVDAHILVTDKQSSAGTGTSRSARKAFLARNSQFALAFSGHESRVEPIFSALEADLSVDAANVVDRIQDIVSHRVVSFVIGQETNDFAEGLMLKREGNGYAPYKVTVMGRQFLLVPYDDVTACFGDRDGVIIGKYLLGKRNILEFPWKVACKYLIAVMKDVAEKTHTVGRLEEYGFDILVLTDSNGCYERYRFNDPAVDTIAIKFEPDSSRDIGSSFQRLGQSPTNSGGTSS